MIRMKPLAVGMTLMFLAIGVPAFTTDVRQPRIVVLASSPNGNLDAGTCDLTRRYVCDELRRLGVDARTSETDYESLGRGRENDADYYVEIADAARGAAPLATVSVATSPSTAVGVSDVVASAAAVIRLYDARTLAEIGRYRLSGSGGGVVPLAVGATRHNFLMALLVGPIVQHAYARDAVRAIARDAAVRITDDIRAR